MGGIYTDTVYGERPWRRLVSSDGPQPNSLSWLRWHDYYGPSGPAPGSAGHLALAVTPPGIVVNGIDEAFWPNGTTAAGPKPAGYPLAPGRLSAGDWIYGSTGGNTLSAAIRTQLDGFIRDKRVLKLPFYGVSNGTGSNAIFHITDLGDFLLIGYGTENGRTYLDLVYLRDTPHVPCS